MFQFGKKVYRTVFSIFFLLFLLLFLYQYRAYLTGPRLAGGNFSPFLNLQEQSFHLKNEVVHSSEAYLNGRKLILKKVREGGKEKLFIDEELFFEKPYSEGILLLRDIFGHEKKYLYKLWIDED